MRLEPGATSWVQREGSTKRRLQEQCDRKGIGLPGARQDKKNLPRSLQIKLIKTILSGSLFLPVPELCIVTNVRKARLTPFIVIWGCLFSLFHTVDLVSSTMDGGNEIDIYIHFRVILFPVYSCPHLGNLLLMQVTRTVITLHMNRLFKNIAIHINVAYVCVSGIKMGVKN